MNLTVETFVRVESRIVMLSNEFFLLEIIIYEVLQTLRENLLALSQLSTIIILVINSYQFPSHTGMNIFNVIVRWIIWFEVLVIDIQQKMFVWYSGTAIFNLEILLPITQIRLIPALHDTTLAYLSMCHDLLFKNLDIQQLCSVCGLTMSKHNHEIIWLYMMNLNFCGSQTYLCIKYCLISGNCLV